MSAVAHDRGHAPSIGVAPPQQSVSDHGGYGWGNAAAQEDLLGGTAEAEESSLLLDEAPGTADDNGAPAADPSTFAALKERAIGMAIAAIPSDIPAADRSRVVAAVASIAGDTLHAVWSTVRRPQKEAEAAVRPGGLAAAEEHLDATKVWDAYLAGPGVLVNDFGRFWAEADGADRVGAAIAAYTEAVGRATHISTDVLLNPAVELATVHSSGTEDEATPDHNFAQAARGEQSERSAYGNAPGGTTALDDRMTGAIAELAARGYQFRISEATGGSHSRTSRHYAGLAFDVDQINGEPATAANADVAGFMAACRELGANEVLGPGDRDHDTHVHCAWPRE